MHIRECDWLKKADRSKRLIIWHYFPPALLITNPDLERIFYSNSLRTKIWESSTAPTASSIQTQTKSKRTFRKKRCWKWRENWCSIPSRLMIGCSNTLATKQESNAIPTCIRAVLWVSLSQGQFILFKRQTKTMPFFCFNLRNNLYIIWY